MYGRWDERCAIIGRVLMVFGIAAAATGCSFFTSERPLIADAIAASPFGLAAVVTLRPEAKPDSPDSADTITLVRSGRDYVAVGLPPDNSLSVRFAPLNGNSEFFILQARLGADLRYAGARVEPSAQRFAYFKATASPADNGPGLSECGSDVCVGDLGAFAGVIRKAIAAGTTDESVFTILKTLDEPGTLNDGLLAIGRQDYLTAVTVLRPLAHFGSLTAQGALGVMYYSGLGVPQDDKVAVAFFRNAAEQGDVQAQNNLGVMYEEGRSVEADLGEAARWYELAAAQGHSIARENLQEIQRLIAQAPANERVPSGTGQAGPDDLASAREFDTPLHADPWLACAAGIDRDRTIAACTEVIEAPRTTSDRLALASRYRGEVYFAAAVAGTGDHFCEDADEIEEHIFSERYLLERPLLAAIRRIDPPVLLIDEVDRADEEFEAFLLEILSDFQVSIPELGTIAATAIPRVVLTSNGTRELSDALRRRCLYHYVDFPDVDREAAIVRTRLPGIDTALALQVSRLIASIRRKDLRKVPGVAETLDPRTSTISSDVWRRGDDRCRPGDSDAGGGIRSRPPVSAWRSG